MAFSLPLAAQPFAFHAGSAAVAGYAPDTAICNGSTQPTAGQTGVYANLRFASVISCDVPAPNGTCSLKASMMETRLEGTNAATQITYNQRVFVIAVNGVKSMPIDLFALVGSLKPYTLTLANIPVTDQHLRITFTASRGNAVMNAIEGSCVPTPIPPFVQNPDGSWNFTGSLHVTGSIGAGGFVASGEGGKLPTAITLQMPDGSSLNGVSGTFVIGNCSVLMQAGVIVSVTCSAPKADLICKTGNCAGIHYFETPSAKLLGVPAPAGFTPSATWVAAQ